jgi:alanyl-tRNA synthetase
LLHFHLSRLPDPPTIAHTHVDAAGLACELVGRSPTAEEIASLEAAVNAHIRSNVPVTGQSLPLALALQVPGIRRPPGPRPADPARIVLIGPANARTATADHPAEFCTGTHLTRTGGIGLFLIAGREPTPAGCRLTAVTGAAALALTHAWRAAAAVPRA